MNTAKLKNIIIVILLLANAFLFVLQVSLRAETRASYEHSLEELVSLYTASGVALDQKMLENADFSVLNVSPARDLDAERAFAEGVLGSVSSVDSGGGIYRYYSTDGMDGSVCLIRSGGTVEASVRREVDDPYRFCEELCLPLGYTVITSLDEGDTLTIQPMRLLDDLEIYNCSLTFSFSGNTLTAVSGCLLPAFDTEGSEAQPLDVVTALVRFLDYRASSGAVCTEVSRLSAGYLLQSSTASPFQLVPVLRVETDVYCYYVNSISGEVSRE